MPKVKLECLISKTEIHVALLLLHHLPCRFFSDIQTIHTFSENLVFFSRSFCIPPASHSSITKYIRCKCEETHNIYIKPITIKNCYGTYIRLHKLYSLSLSKSFVFSGINYPCSQVICLWFQDDNFLWQLFSQAKKECSTNFSSPWIWKWDKHGFFWIFPLLLLPVFFKSTQLFNITVIHYRWGNQAGSNDALRQFG